MSTEHSQLVVYTTKHCPHSVRLRRQLQRTDLIWREVDIQTDSAATHLVESLNDGNRTVPTVVFADGTAATNPTITQVLAHAAASTQEAPMSHGTADRAGLADIAVLLLPWVIRFTAAGYLAIWTVVLALSATGNVNLLPHWLFRLTVWGDHSADAVQVMLACIYVTWSVFLWLSARNPIANKLFIDFTLAANLAHFGGMGVMAVYMHGEHHHLYGDVLAGLLSITPLAALWIPVRRGQTTTRTDTHV